MISGRPTEVSCVLSLGTVGMTAAAAPGFQVEKVQQLASKRAHVKVRGCHRLPHPGLVPAEAVTYFQTLYLSLSRSKK